MKKTINLLFPHQLIAENPLLQHNRPCYLVEEYLFFKQYPFHKQKIAFHRASMQQYKTLLKQRGFEVFYIEAIDPLADIRNLLPHLLKKGVTEFHVIDPTDNWLEKRIRNALGTATLHWYESPLFLNTKEQLAGFFRKDKKFYFQTTFYKQQRVQRNLLLTKNKEPLHGQWSFDAENRKKYPKNLPPPPVNFPDVNPYWEEAFAYVNTHFSDHVGEVGATPLYPTSHAAAATWLEDFLTKRFYNFGTYEDAIVAEASILHHSLVSPLINVGLLTPQHVLNRSIAYAEKENIPINDTEGFVRQLIGWREFMRGLYESRGTEQRTNNHWEFTRKIPESFYTGKTGIAPIDITIQKVLKTGYCHHIERLMVLGNFMLLCEFEPNDVYQWFMELFIDAYDWVMVPNVYGMSQFADGGLMATKPYIGGSNYLKKMSNYPKGGWETIWDGLFWHFIDTHSRFFKSNPRMSMLVHSFTKMTPDKKAIHITNANRFLSSLDKMLQNERH